jgi:hypothetical protein
VLEALEQKERIAQVMVQPSVRNVLRDTISTLLTSLAQRELVHVPVGLLQKASIVQLVVKNFVFLAATVSI